MKNVPFPKLIKWVVSGATHPIVIFNEALLRETAVEELGPEYATKPFPWAFDEDTTGSIFNFVCEELRRFYKSEKHFQRDVNRISSRVLDSPYILKGFNPFTEHYGAFEQPFPAIEHSIRETIEQVRSLKELPEGTYKMPMIPIVITDGVEGDFSERTHKFLEDQGLQVVQSTEILEG